MDQVTIRAVVAAHGLRKGAEVTVAETPLVAGAIHNGVFAVIDRIPSSQDDTVPPSQAGTGETFPDETVPDPETPAETFGGGDEFEQDLIRAMTEPIDPEVAADNSTVVPSHEPGTRKRRG